MIDDRQTCDVCGEEFNEERPHHVHQEKKPNAKPEPVVCEVCKPGLDASVKGSRPPKKGVS